MLLIRFLLARENKKRDAEPADDKYDDVYIEVVLPDGTVLDQLTSLRKDNTGTPETPYGRRSSADGSPQDMT